MFKALCSIAALIAFVEVSDAQTPAAMEGAKQVAGLFASTCVRFAGNPIDLRNFMKDRHVPELNPQGRSIFLRDHVGVGFDTTNRVTRLALVSEDNGLCSAFAAQADAAQATSLIEAAAKAQGLNLVRTGQKETDGAHSTVYEVNIKDRPYKLVLSSNPLSDASVQIAITLSPQAI